MEDTLFRSGNMHITRSMVQIGNASYPTSQISGVTIHSAPDSRGAFRIILGTLLAAVILFGGGFVSSQYRSIPYSGEMFLFGALPASLFVFLFFFVKGARTPRLQILRFRTLGGDVAALTSTDRALVESAKAAIERAFSHH